MSKNWETLVSIVNSGCRFCISGSSLVQGRFGDWFCFFKPQANDSCTSCGICAEGCPVGAIDKADPRKTDTAHCISCMRCRDICPKHARDLDPVFIQAAAEKMAPKLGGHKKNYLFL